MGWTAHVIFGLDSPNMNLPVQVVTMSKKKGRGGARRNKVPEVDEEHLLDSLLSHARKLGGHALSWGNIGSWKLPRV